MIITQNVMDKIVIHIFFKHFSLEKLLRSKMTPNDAIDHIVGEMTMNEMDGSHESRYGMIFLDQDEYERKTFKKVVQNIRLVLIEKKISHMPKIISMTSIKGRKKA